jgi:hypothetical protein
MTTMAQPTTTDLQLTPRVSPPAAVRHALTLAWRSLIQIKHNPMELIDLSLQPLMFVLLFAYVFGGAISGSVQEFLQFGLAGIITQNALFLTMSTARHRLPDGSRRTSSARSGRPRSCSGSASSLASGSGPARPACSGRSPC